MSEYLTVAEVAERMRLHQVTIRRYIRAGKLRAVRVGRRVRVPVEAVEALLQEAAQDEPALHEAAAVYEVTEKMEAAALGDILVELRRLPAEDLARVADFVAEVKAEREAAQRRALAREIVAEVDERVKRRSMSREEAAERFWAAVEAIRADAIVKGTAIDEVWESD